MGRGLGCLFGLLILGALSVELWAFLWVRAQFEDTLGPLLLLIAISYIGVRIAVAQGRKLPMDLLAGTAGRRLIGVIGGALLAFPGFASDVPGILLLLPPVQLALASFGQRLAASLLRNIMGRMMGGGSLPKGGFPGGLFPGMKPDERFRKPVKTIDTTIEKD
jgi:UPF0716 family protein affecting phage T7 exclusion